MKNLKKITYPNIKYRVSNIGFTLIEFLIVLTIIFIFSGLSLAYYNNFIEEKKLEIETQKLIDVLELAKKKTLSADIENYSCDNFYGYQVYVDNSSYKISLCCSLDCNNNYPIQNYTLAKNISITNSSLNILFKPLTANTTETSITIKNTFLNKCFDILINSIGIIEKGNKYSC